jgi:hypothetical protein
MGSRHLTKQGDGEGFRTREVAGLRLIENVYAAGLGATAHWHERAWFCFVLKGAYTEAHLHQTRECLPSTLFFHPGDYAHTCSPHTKNLSGVKDARATER